MELAEARRAVVEEVQEVPQGAAGAEHQEDGEALGAVVVEVVLEVVLEVVSRGEAAEEAAVEVAVDVFRPCLSFHTVLLRRLGKRELFQEMIFDRNILPIIKKYLLLYSVLKNVSSCGFHVQSFALCCNQGVRAGRFSCSEVKEIVRHLVW